MAHVSNMHTHLPRVVCETADRQCIVKVFCIARVDGKGRDLAKIFTFGDFLLGNTRMEFVCRTFHVFGIGVG